jgi:hypothetical protein
VEAVELSAAGGVGTHGWRPWTPAPPARPLPLHACACALAQMARAWHFAAPAGRAWGFAWQTLVAELRRLHGHGHGRGRVHWLPRCHGRVHGGLLWIRPWIPGRRRDRVHALLLHARGHVLLGRQLHHGHGHDRLCSVKILEGAFDSANSPCGPSPSCSNFRKRKTHNLGRGATHGPWFRPCGRDEGTSA